MATLHGMEDNTTNSGLVSVQVTPTTPSTSGPHNEYSITVLQPNGSKTYIHDVHRWKLGHYFMLCAARAFKQIDQLIDKKFPFDITARLPEDELEKYNSPVYIKVGIDWLKFIIWSRTEGDRVKVFVEMFIQAERKYFEGLIDDIYNRTYLICTPEQAKQFGSDLEKELLEAEMLRERLGVWAREDLM